MADEIVQFTNRNRVPPRFTTLRGARLTLEQINEILADAQMSATGPHDFAKAFGEAKARFQETNEAQNGIWVSK